MGSDNLRRTNLEQSEATTRRMLDIAQTLFTSKGYADTSVEEIVSLTGVTRGALYHHFKNKDALFEAVFLDLQRQVGERIAQAGSQSLDLWESLFLGCREFLAASAEPAIRRIVILDSPSVLGIDAWRSADEQSSTYQLRAGLRELSAAGEIGQLDPDMVTAMLNGALNDAALQIGASSEPEVAFRAACDTLRALLAGIRVS